ncbi:MAG TPA: type II secretion system protein [Pirellulales bacterium]|jgi:prepilin-type N-terminal cleavage/methylation domain-containing protein
MQLRTISRRGFTLVEALVSTTIAAVAGAALLQGVYSSIGDTRSGQEQTIAAGLAQQMMDEIAGKMYAATTNTAGVGRSKFNDIADYNNIRSTPPLDPWGVAVGDDDGRGTSSASSGLRHPSFRLSSALSTWRREVDVYYVNPADMTTRLTGAPTANNNCQMVEVRIYVTDAGGNSRLVTTLKRVFSFVPTT